MISVLCFKREFRADAQSRPPTHARPRRCVWWFPPAQWWHSPPHCGTKVTPIDPKTFGTDPLTSPFLYQTQGWTSLFFFVQPSLLRTVQRFPTHRICQEQSPHCLCDSAAYRCHHYHLQRLCTTHPHPSRIHSRQMTETSFCSASFSRYLPFFLAPFPSCR